MRTTDKETPSSPRPLPRGECPGAPGRGPLPPEFPAPARPDTAMTPSARPDAAMIPTKCRLGWWIRFLVCTIMVTMLAGGPVWFLLGGQGRADLPTYKVGLEILQPTYQTRGDVEASQATDVVCRVKARAAGSKFSTTILWVIDDGSPVRRDTVLVRLDD